MDSFSTSSCLWPLGGAHQIPHRLISAVAGLLVETVPSTCACTHKKVIAVVLAELQGAQGGFILTFQEEQPPPAAFRLFDVIPAPE